MKINHARKKTINGTDKTRCNLSDLRNAVWVGNSNAIHMISLSRIACDIHKFSIRILATYKRKRNIKAGVPSAESACETIN